MARFFWSSLAVQTIRLITLPIFLALRILISSPRSFGCSHLSSKGKSNRNIVVLSFEEKEEGRKINQCLFSSFPPHVVTEWIRETHIHYSKEDKCDMAEAGCCWFFFFNWEKCNSIFSDIAEFTDFSGKCDNGRRKERQRRNVAAAREAQKEKLGVQQRLNIGKKCFSFCLSWFFWPSFMLI